MHGFVQVCGRFAAVFVTAALFFNIFRFFKAKIVNILLTEKMV